MQKRCSIIMMGVTAILISYCHTTYASETVVHKCTRDNGKIVFQDRPCPDEQAAETIVIEHKDNNSKFSGLRQLELLQLARLHQKQMRELPKKYDLTIR